MSGWKLPLFGQGLELRFRESAIERPKHYQENGDRERASWNALNEIDKISPAPGNQNIESMIDPLPHSGYDQANEPLSSREFVPRSIGLLLIKYLSRFVVLIHWLAP
jgi:hypothetical protein